MSAASREGEDDGEPKYVGSPIELYRVTDPIYADQALVGWEAYVRRTLGASMAAGGRFNPQCEFGAIYTTDDERTAWEELAVRLARQGQRGISPEMRLLRLVISNGTYVDLTTDAAQTAWHVSESALSSQAPTPHEEALCLDVGRGVRVVADFLQSPSARHTGNNIPLFPDRTGSDLRVNLARVEPNRVPEHLLQQPSENW